MVYIKKLDVKSFRGITSLQLEKLSSINILTGDNNSGKTSVLELLKSYDHPTNLKLWGAISRRSSSMSSYSYYEGFYDLFDVNSEDKTIEYIVEKEDEISQTSEENIRVEAKITEEELPEEKYREIMGLTYDSAEPGQFHTVKKMKVQIVINGEKKSEGCVYEGQSRGVSNNKLLLSKPKGNIVYITASSHTDADVYLTDILKYPDLYEEMLEILKDYDKDIISINYDNDSRYPGKGVYKILSKSYKEALPLNVYGDGMKKAILLMSAVLKAQNGILLLDEFETAIHTSAMDKTFRWILETCLRLNVQVFLTSHSKEAIDKVLKCSEKVRSHTVLYTLYKEEEKIVVRRLSGEKAVEVQDEMGLELR